MVEEFNRLIDTGACADKSRQDREVVELLSIRLLDVEPISRLRHTSRGTTCGVLCCSLTVIETSVETWRRLAATHCSCRARLAEYR